MNYKVIALLLICLILLSSCYSAKQSSLQPDMDTVGTVASVNTGISTASTGSPAATVSQEVKTPSASIMDLYKNWDGALICNYRSYSAGSTIYYSEDNVECDIQLPSSESVNTTTDDLKLLEDKYVTVEDVLREPNNEKIDYVDFSAAVNIPNLIKFRMQPSRDPLKISFKTKPDQAPLVFNFEYAAPLTYTISKPFDADGKLYAVGVRQYLQTGASHIYDISFSEAVDKASVEQRINEGLQGISKKINWVSEKMLTITLQLTNKNLVDDYEDYRLNFAGVKTKQGLTNFNSQEDQTIRFQPTNKKSFYKYNLIKKTEEPFFNSLIAYSSLDISPNGKWILAEELGSHQSVFVTNYSLLDLTGKRIKELDLEIHDPIWLADGNSLLFKEQNSVIRYDIATGEKHVVWSDPEKTGYTSFDYDRASGRLLVTSGHSNNEAGIAIDLHLFNSVNDNKPRLIIDALITQVEDEAWSGLHYTLPIYFMDKDLIYLEKTLPPDEKSSQYQMVRTLMDWKSGEFRSLDKTGDMYMMNSGKILHQEGKKWSVYDAASGLETPLKFSINEGEWVETKTINDGLVLLSVSSDKYYLLDLKTLSLQQIPKSRHILSASAWNGTVVTYSK